jgi:hypothetical protein
VVCMHGVEKPAQDDFVSAPGAIPSSQLDWMLKLFVWRWEDYVDHGHNEIHQQKAEKGVFGMVMLRHTSKS